jgi:hypothetical protein
VDAADLWVYRAGAQRSTVAACIADLDRAISSVEREGRRAAVSALVVAGEVEAAFADAGIASAAAAVTDALAEIALGRDVPIPRVTAVGHEVVRSPPEGFAYYGLDPRSFGSARSLAGERDVLVVGIRSIGTTLSAIVRAAIGPRARRVTVRPSGPPFDRVLERAPDHEGRDVILVDEGPGLSGSTFLGVAEAFVRAGTPPDRIAIACTAPVLPSRLRAANAAARWRYRAWVAPPLERPEGRDLSGGRWREGIDDRPLAFPPFERPKVLVGDRLFKHEGLGSAADAARVRGEALADAGFALSARDEGDGWFSTSWQARGSPPDLARIAAYCAFRARAFSVTAATDLGPVIAKNARALGVAIPKLAVERPTICDGRMEPHEWVSRFKTDAISHGDDHFFPGPTDIAWDLAGAILGFGLDVEVFLEAYRRASGDDARPRIREWLSAFAIQRAAFITFAAESSGPEEQPRLARERARLVAFCAGQTGASMHHG